MARRYCTVDDVKFLLPENVRPQGTTAANPMRPQRDNLTNDDLDFFMEMASDRIDMALATVYETPLKRLNYDGSGPKYPPAVRYIASVLAAQMIYGQKLQGAEHQKSEEQERKETDAMEQLTALQNGEAALRGQATRGSRFLTETLYNAPYNPSQGGKSQGRTKG